PGGIEHDHRRGHDLDPAEHDENPGVNGDGACGDQRGRHEPCPKGQPADASSTVGPDEVLRCVGCSGQPGADEAQVSICSSCCISTRPYDGRLRRGFLSAQGITAISPGRATERVTATKQAGRVAIIFRRGLQRTAIPNISASGRRPPRATTPEVTAPGYWLLPLRGASRSCEGYLPWVSPPVPS